VFGLLEALYGVHVDLVLQRKVKLWCGNNLRVANIYPQDSNFSYICLNVLFAVLLLYNICIASMINK
jgi:hypothetical protein